MILSELVRMLPGVCRVVGDDSMDIVGMHHDSREILPGDLFVARPGGNVDGARYVRDAVGRGARAVLAPGVSDALLEGVGVPRVLVDDLAKAFGVAASRLYGDPSGALSVVGITGTNGKTTVAHLVASAVDAALGRVGCGLMGTVGHHFRELSWTAEHTTPEADELARVLSSMQRAGASHVAMEVSSHALALERVAGIQFQVACFTNLSLDHLEFHGSMEAYGEAKAQLFTRCAPAKAVIHVGDPFGACLAARATSPVVTVAGSPGVHADLVAHTVAFGPHGFEAKVRTAQQEIVLRSRLVGQHNLENLLVALGVVEALGLDLERAARGLEAAGGAPGRLERCDGPEDDVLVFVDYAHTPDALARVLDAVRSAAHGQVVCVFGCGGDRDKTKRAPMGQAVASRADRAIVTSDNPRSEDPARIAEAVVEGMSRLHHSKVIVELDRRQAIEQAILGANIGDTIVIAGKGHETLQIAGDVRRAFDDRAEARRALALRRGGNV